MEEESGVKAPVTRLRRRLSVEAEDVSSPQPPSTPKKRSARLAAKPLLDNIDENAPIASPKPTRGRKSMARDLTEPEEKIVTPSRRSVRIKSNTSLTSETSLALDSPRAKRAARRNSNVGSDTEAPLTPVLQTRKTRRNSEGVEHLADDINKEAIQLTKKTIIFSEKPQPQSKSKEFQKTPSKLAEKRELQNTPPNLPAEIVPKPAKQLTNKSIIFPEESQIQKPQAKRKSKELHKTPEKVLDKPELQKTPQNVPEKTELQRTPKNAELQNSTSTVENLAKGVIQNKTATQLIKETIIFAEEPKIHNTLAKVKSIEFHKTPPKVLEKIELEKASQNVKLQNFSTIENLAEVVKEPLLQLSIATADEPAAKINSKELLKTPQKKAEQIEHLQKRPHNATEEIELKNPSPIVENEVEQSVVTNHVKQFAQAELQKPRVLIQRLKVPDIAKLQIRQTTLNSFGFAQVATTTTAQLVKETSISAPKPDLQRQQKKRKCKKFHQVPQKNKPTHKEPENIVIPVNPYMLLNPFCTNPEESRQPNVIYQKVLQTKDVTVYLKNMPQIPTQRSHCNVSKTIKIDPKIKEAPETPMLPNTPKKGRDKKIIAMFPDYHDNSKKCKGIPKITQKLQLHKSQVKTGDIVHINNMMNYSHVMNNALNFNKLSNKAILPTTPLNSQRQSPRKSSENSIDMLSLDHLLPLSSNVALLPNSRCKSSSKAEKSDNLYLNISLPNSSIGAFPLDSQHQSPRKSAENSINILLPDYSLPNSSNVAALPNCRCKCSRRAEEPKNNLPVDKSLPNSSNGSIPLNSQCQSPWKSAENSIDIVPPDYSLPNSSNEALLPNSRSKSSRKAEKSNLSLVLLPSFSVGAIPPDSQSQCPTKSAENYDIELPDYSLSYSSNEALLPNNRWNISGESEKSNLSLDISLPSSSIGAIPLDSQRLSRRKSAENSIDIEPPDYSIPNSSNEALLPNSQCTSSRKAEKSDNLCLDKSLPNSSNGAIPLNNQCQSPSKSAENSIDILPPDYSLPNSSNKALLPNSRCKSSRKAEISNNLSLDKSLPNPSNRSNLSLDISLPSLLIGAILPDSHRQSPRKSAENSIDIEPPDYSTLNSQCQSPSKAAENSIDIRPPDYSLPNSSNEPLLPNSRCKNSTKAEISYLSLNISLPSSSIGAILSDSHRQSPRKSAENSIDMEPPDYSLPNSSNEALLPNSQCKSSRKAEISNNLSLDKSLLNSSIEAIPLISQRQSPNKSAENSIDILPPDHSLPSSPNEALLPNIRRRSSRLAEKSKKLSLDNSLPNPSNGAIPHNSQCQSPSKSAENSVDILPPDYSLPNSSNEALLPNSQCKSSRKAEISNNLSLDKSLPNSSNRAIPLNSQCQSPSKSAENSIDILPPDYSLPNSSNEALLPNSQCKSSRKAEISNNLSLDKSLPNSSNRAIPLNSQCQSPSKSAENSVDILPPDYSLPNSSNEALLPNSQCKSSRKAEISNNLSLDKSLPNSSNRAIPLNSQCQSPSKSAENSIDILPPDYSLPNSSNEALLPNSRYKSSRKAEISNLSLDISLPSSSIETIPPDSHRQSPRKSAENSMDIEPPDYSIPNSSNEALLPNSQCKRSRKDEKFNNLSFDKSLSNSSIEALPLISQRQSPKKSAENSIDILPPDHSLPSSSNEALLPNIRRKSYRLAEKSKKLSLDNSLPNSRNTVTKSNSQRKSPKKSSPKKRLPQENPVTESIIIFPKHWGKTKPITKQPDIFFPKNWGTITKQPGNGLKTYFPDSTNSSVDTLKKQITNLENVKDIGDSVSTVTDFTFATDSEHSIIVYIDEDQTNVDKLLQLSQEPSNKTESGDQCVPIMNRLDETAGIVNDLTPVNFGSLSKPKKKTESVSSLKGVEPMDIDESIPLNISITDYSKENLSQVNNQVDFGEPIKSKLSKSSSDVSERVKNDVEKGCNENKSTLILSRETNESITENNLGKSPIIARKETLENLSNVSDIGKNRGSKKKSLSHITENNDTPLKNKNSNILGMQTSTPVTSTKHEIIVEKSLKNTSKNTSSKDISVASRESNSYLSDESSDEENMSKLVIDEAEDAGEDYESGDSRDESEKQYELQNEIPNKGDTLDTNSSEDGSDDEDYENDSFVVSSDQEDDELLSGTGDDLSMSDKELTMAAKSKKKFNDRKLKEQKKASKEMYTARHNKEAPLNDTSDDDTREVKPKKKKNRMRLDSHELSAIKSDANTSVSRKTNESKHILDNSCNNSVVNEHEITAVVDESIIQKTDPLKTAIKAEPMTPQKILDISTVNISVRQDVEEVQVAEDASIMHANETSDPLQATMAFTDDEEYSSSGNEEIIQSYDSMLSELNKKNNQNKDHDISLNIYKKSKVKAMNPIVDQLNLTNTKDRKRRTTDQNQNKSNKTSNQTEADVTDDTSSDSLDLKLLFPDDDSDTSEVIINKSHQSNAEDFIPLKRTEGKTDLNRSKENQGNISPIKTSEGNKKKNKKLSITQKAEQSGEVASVEQTDDAAINLANQSAAETSISKKNNKKRLSKENVDLIDGGIATENNSSSKKKSRRETSFTVIDSTETETTESELNVGKKKNKKSKESFIVTDSTDNNQDVSIGSMKKNKRKESLTVTDTTDTEVTENEANNSVSSSKKKNRKATESLTVYTDMIENEMNISVGKNKQKKKKSSESFTATDVTEKGTPEKVKIEHEMNISVGKNKQKKNKSSESFTTTDVTEMGSTENMIENEINLSVGKDKQKHKKSLETFTATDITEMGTTENLANISVACNKKKHRKASESLLVADAPEIDKHLQNKSLAETPGSAKKKKKKISESQSVDELETKELTDKTENAINTSLSSHKKKNRKVSESSAVPDYTDGRPEKPLNTSLPLENAKKKKNKNLSTSLPTSQLNNENTTENITNSSKKKKQKHSESSEAINENDLKESVDDAPEEASSRKRKRKSSIFGEKQDGAQESSKLQNDSLLAAGSHKKKIKLYTEVENEFKLGDVKAMSPNTDIAMDDGVVENKKKKKKQSKLNDKAVAVENESAADSQPEPVAGTSQDYVKKKQKTQTEITDQDRAKNIPEKRSRKKRKEREDDEGFKQTKVLKENFFDNIQISRLPNAFLQQLENPKSKEPKNKKIVSTSAFVVEETVKRRNKPSNYLEDSIYLNSGSPEKRRNNKIEKPKVLPFVPTASTSGRGFTTNFQVKVCPQEVKFIAQSSETVNFKNDYIQSQKFKKLGTYEMYKKQRKVKLSKF